MQSDLTDFYPVLATFALSGLLVGLAINISRWFVPRIPYFASENIPELDYRLVARSMAFSGLLTSLAYALVAYPMYSSESFSSGFIVKVTLCLVIAAPIMEACEALICKFSRRA